MRCPLYLQKRTFIAASKLSAKGQKRIFGPTRRLRLSTRFCEAHSNARQNDPDFGERPRLRIDLDCAAMLLNDDVMTDGEAKAGALTCRLRREERIEHLL